MKLRIHDEEEKIFRGKAERLREKRGRFLDMHVLRSLIYSLCSISPGYEHSLYLAGKEYSKKAVKKLKIRDLEQSFMTLSIIFDRTNLGTMKYKIFEEKHLAHVIIEENAISYALGFKRNACHFISGYIAGFLEGIFKGNIIVYEIKCASKGDRWCEFVVKF
jgi:predicted hydrocarbon binding protein